MLLLENRFRGKNMNFVSRVIGLLPEVEVQISRVVCDYKDFEPLFCCSEY